MALCLSLAACGNSDDVAGEDWRTTGVVVGSGTITHDSESVDVLVTADPNSAAFYRDQEEQVLFDSVAFPETIEDISSSAFQISFDDQNGDEESDVLVEIGHEDMSNTTMLWLWDPQERYVYQPDYSSFHVPGVDGPEEPIAPYVGLWATSLFALRESACAPWCPGLKPLRCGGIMSATVTPRGSVLPGLCLMVTVHT